MEDASRFRSFFRSPFFLILVLFLSSRLILTVTGIISHSLLESAAARQFTWHYSKHLWLSAWAVWDSGWYLDIAKNGYALSLLSDLPKQIDPGQINFGFFPLYPIAISLVSKVLGGHYLVAALAVSNSCLLASAYFLHKLARAHGTEADARRAVTLLFLFPFSFILSAVFAESLFLALSLALFYCLWKERYAYALLAGIGLGLCRPAAVFAVPAVALILARACIRDKRKIAPASLAFAGIPLGYALFSWFCHSVTGDWFFYSHLKQAAWGSQWKNPLSLLAHCLYSPIVPRIINGWAVFAGSVLTIATWKKIGGVYALLGLSLLLLPLTAGEMVVPGMMRYMAAIFPLVFSLAALSGKRAVTIPLLAVFCILQIVLMAVWSNGFGIIV